MGYEGGGLFLVQDGKTHKTQNPVTSQPLKDRMGPRLGKSLGRPPALLHQAT